MADVTVRFAPSPTGVLHLGGARTALFNFLWARNQGGRFLLRIEDTDKERSTEESTRAILTSMEWLGMKWDEEPVRQSERVDEHKQALQRLIDDGKVYKCYCTPEERAAMRDQAMAEKRPALYDGRCDGKPDDPQKPFVWRFRMPKEGQTVFEDMVQGRIVTPNEELEDLVIARADGSPLYNFVVVVDDAAMGITHVIRGKDHLSNTPKQIKLYEALGLSVPRFGHLPLILGLSKRLRSAGIESYRDQGYLPQAVNNYISRLGWSHGDQEIFTTEELIALFRLEDVNRSEGALNLEKMEWINQQHIQRSSKEELAELTAPFLKKSGVSAQVDMDALAAACETRRTHARTLVEMAEEIRFFFVPDTEITIDDKAKTKHLTSQTRDHLGALADALATCEHWSAESLHTHVSAFCEERGIKLKHVAQPARVAFTGQARGPGLFEMMVVLGKESTIARLKNASQAA